MLPKVRAAIDARAKKQATDLPNAREAEAKTRTAMLARRAVAGDIDQLDLDNLDALGRITGDLANTYIESVSAAKITSATMLATTLTLAGTEASNNKTSLVMIGDATMRVNDGTLDRIRISNSGLELSPADESNTPAQIVGRGLFNTGSHHSGIWLFENASRRGWSLRSDGIGAGGADGHFRLIATKNAAAVNTDVGSWASVEANNTGNLAGVLANHSGVVIRNMLYCVGPARIGGAADITGALAVAGRTDLNAATYLNAGIARADGNALQVNAGVDVNVGDIRLTAASSQGIRSVGGTPLDLYAPTSSIRVFNALRAEAGLIVVGASSLQGLTVSGNLSIPSNTIGPTELKAHASDDLQRAVVANNIRDGHIILSKIAGALKDAPQGDLALRRIGTFWGGTSIHASANNHGHSVSYKELPKDKRKKLAASREKLHTNMIPKAQMQTLPVAELAKRLWLLERQMAAVLHMLCDDPERPASVREADIVAGTETDNSIDRYEEFTQTYEELHPLATNFFNGFTIEEMNL